MRLHRFYIQNENFETLKEGDIFTCKNEEVAGQITRVLRMQVGDRVLFFNESGEYELVIQGISKKELVCEAKQKIKQLVQKKRFALVQSLIKKDKFEWVAQKATELGITDIFPVITERSEKKGLDRKRLEKIILEATEQSGWGKSPILHEIETLEKTLHTLKKEDFELYRLDMDGTKLDSHSKEIAFCVGPEGGWGNRDKEIFNTYKTKTVTLGTSVLRTETAAIIGSYHFLQQ